MPGHTAAERRKKAESLGSGGARKTAKRIIKRGSAARFQMLQARRAMGVKLKPEDEAFLRSFSQSTDEHQ